MAQYLEVQQILLFPEAARRRPPIRRVIVSDRYGALMRTTTPMLAPSVYSLATAHLPHPTEEPLAQPGILDPRPVWAMQRERDFLLDWSRTVAARLRTEQAEEDRRLGIDPLLRRVGGDAGFVEWQREIERRVRWLDDQIRRKNAAIRNGLIAA